MPDVSIAISAQDNLSSAIMKMAQNLSPLRKDLSMLQGDLNKLNTTKASLKVDMAAAKRELNAAKKAFETVGDAASRSAYEAAQAKYDTLQSNLQAVGKTARQAEKDMLSLSGTASKVENKMSGGVRPAQGTAPDVSQTGVFGALSKAGLTKMAGDALSQISGTAIGSLFGDAGGTMVSSTLSGAATGAALGSVIPGLGTVVGGIAGGALGAVQGATQIFQKEDEAFKSYVQEQTEARVSERQSLVTSGSALAATRENDLRALTTLFGNDIAGAQEFQKSLIEIGRTPPFSYGLATALSKDMLGLGLSPEAAINRINSVADAAAALSWSDGQVSTMISTLESAQLTGKMETRVMKSLSKMGVNAYEALAAQFNMSQSEIAENLDDLDVEEAIDAIYAYMAERFMGAAKGLEHTFSGVSGILDSLQEDMQSAAGEGYNEVRAVGMQKEIDWYSDGSGQKLEDVNRAIGAFAASLENSKEGYIRGAMDVVMASDEFVEAQKTANNPEATTQAQEEAWAKMGELLARAKTMGMNQYNASEGAQIALESDLHLAQTIRQDTSADAAYYDAGYRRGQMFSKGRAAGILDANINALSKQGAPNWTPEQALYYTGDPSMGKAHAYGLMRVPYDNYPALLHRDERVLTANQARQQDTGTGGVLVTGNTFTVREEADIGRIAQELVRQATLAAAARATG